MNTVTISLAAQVKYKFCGLFTAKSDEWTHMSRDLEEYQLIIVKEGTLYIADKHTKHSISKGEYLIMEPGLQYGWKPSSCSFYWVHFHVTMLGTENEKTFEIPCQGLVHSMTRIDMAFSNLTDADFAYHDSTTNNLYTLNILLELFNQGKANDPESHTYRDYLLKNIKNYIKWNQAYHPTVAELAEYFDYHPKYLSSLFHKKTGMTLKQYLINQTMESAKSELYNTNHSILSIALGLGFSDSHSFSYAFKRHTGMSPTEYRASHHPIDKNSD